MQNPRGPCGHPSANNPEIHLAQSFSPTFFPSPAPLAAPDPHSRPIPGSFPRSRSGKPTRKRPKKKKSREEIKSWKKTTKVSQRGEGSSCCSGARHSRDLGAFQSPARAGHWWHWWHWSERPRPAGRSFPPLYSPSAGIRMGMRSRIRLSRCRLLPALGSMKVFWSGITSVVSWAWEGGTGAGF